MAVSVTWGGKKFVCPYKKSPTIWGVYIGAPDVWKLPGRFGGWCKAEVGFGWFRADRLALAWSALAWYEVGHISH